MEISNQEAIQQSPLSHNYDLFITEIRALPEADLKSTIQDLNKICMEFDPYQPNYLDEDIKELISRFKLDDMLGNPFTFTNNLLKILTNAEEELKLRNAL